MRPHRCDGHFSRPTPLRTSERARNSPLHRLPRSRWPLRSSSRFQLLSFITIAGLWRMPSKRILLEVGTLICLAMIAVVASHARLPDSYWYTSMAEQPIIPGCASIACFRVLVSWAMWLIPGVELKWRIYAVVFNALAALAVFDLSLTFGLSRRSAIVAMALSAFGFGSLWTLFDPFNSDPLIFFLTPLLT